VHVHTYKQRSGICAQDGAGLLDDFTASRVADEGVVRLDVSSGEQPALQAAVQHQQDAVAGGAEHQAGASDVAGIELPAGEWLGGGGQQGEDEFFAFGGFTVVPWVEAVQQGGDGCGIDHASIMT